MILVDRVDGRNDFLGEQFCGPGHVVDRAPLTSFKSGREFIVQEPGALGGRGRLEFVAGDLDELFHLGECPQRLAPERSLGGPVDGRAFQEPECGRLGQVIDIPIRPIHAAHEQPGHAARVELRLLLAVQDNLSLDHSAAPPATIFVASALILSASSIANFIMARTWTCSDLISAMISAAGSLWSAARMSLPSWTSYHTPTSMPSSPV